MPTNPIPRQRRPLLAALLLGGPLGLAFASAGFAQDDSAQRATMLQYETDASCAAAGESWLIGMPNGTPKKEQDDTLNVWGFYTRRVQASAQAAGRPAYLGVGAAQAFVGDLLPHLKSPDSADADKARSEAADGTHKCAARPEFQNRAKDGQP